MATLIEKRSFSRSACKGFSCNVKTGVNDDYELSVLNISNGGMLLKDSKQSGLKENESNTFYFYPDENKKTSKKGKVIRRQEKTIAVKFSSPFDLSKIKSLRMAG